jgi:AcrR family transcriptional regulator
MPAKIKVTQEMIVDSVLSLIREGTQNLTARTVAARLGCSTQPIFSNFNGMEELKKAALDRAYAIYYERILHAMDAEKRYPPFKASGMAYIAFAVEEPRLFRFLFMRDRSDELIADESLDEAQTIISVIMEATGLSRDRAARLHRDLWIFVHGVAVMYATGFLPYDEADASERVSEMYFALLERLQKNQLSERGESHDGN